MWLFQIQCYQCFRYYSSFVLVHSELIYYKSAKVSLITYHPFTRNGSTTNQTHPFPYSLKPSFEPDPTAVDKELWTISLSAAAAWDTIISHGSIVHWQKLVWYPKCIPLHSLILWMAIQKEIWTKDKLSHWGINHPHKLFVLFASRKQTPDTISHIFSKCSYSKNIWKQVCHLSGCF